MLGYAKRLAARGINVILVSRSQEKLDNCAKEIKDKYKVSGLVWFGLAWFKKEEEG